MEKGECIILGIYVDENTRLVGSVCLFNFNEDHSIGELGYELHPTYQGKGIMVEALELFLAWIKKQSIVQKLTACIHEENEASSKLIQKLGFLPDRSKPRCPKTLKAGQNTLTNTIPMEAGLSKWDEFWKGMDAVVAQHAWIKLRTL